MFCTTFIDKEISAEEFVKVMDIYKANFVAPIKFNVSLDDYGCQPYIFDDEEMFKAGNFFIDSIVRNVDKYSEKNNMRLLSLSRQDIYLRQSTQAEAKIGFRQMAELHNEKLNEKLEQIRWKKGSEVEGILITDIDGNKYDYPIDYRWIKSVFATAVACVNSSYDDEQIKENLFQGVDILSKRLLQNNPDKDVKIIHEDFTLIEVGPKKTSSCPFLGSQNRCGCIDYFNQDNYPIIFIKTRIPKVGASDRYHNHNFKEWLKEYDEQKIEIQDLFLPDQFYDEKRKN